MLELRTLGSLELRGSDGAELRAPLAQPKRAALLSYLAVERPHHYHRRDTLLALFWPEFDERHARAALNQGIAYLRRALGVDVIISRGQEELGIDPAQMWCDARAFDEAVAAGQLEDALDLYGGDLLNGFHASGAPLFERWLEEQRTDLRKRACGAAWQLAEREEAEGRSVAGGHFARLAVKLSPLEEVPVRRLMELLRRVGDRAGGLTAYEDFARRLHQEYELEPSAELRRLVADIRDDYAVPPQPVPPSSDIGAGAGGAPNTAAPPVLRRFARLRAPIAVLGLAALAAGALFTGQRMARDDPREAASSKVMEGTAGRVLDHPSGYQFYREALVQVERWQQVAGNRERARLAPVIVSLLQDAIVQDSTFTEAYVELAVQHLRISWFAIDKSGIPVQQAWAALSKAMRLRPDAPEVHRGLGYYYLWAERNYARAAQEFRRVLRHRPDDGEMLFALGGALRRQGKLEESVRHLERALALNPSALLAHSTLCETYLGMRRYTQAERCLLSLVEKGPDRAYSHAYLMRLYVLWRGDLPKVRAVLEAAGRSITPAELPENWADLYLFERNYAASLDHLDPLLAAAPDSGVGLSGQADPYGVRAQLLAAWLYTQLGRLGEARAMYARVAAKIERAPSAPPQQGGRHTWLAIAYAGLGRHDDAVQEARTAERLFRSANDLWGWPIRLEIVTQAYVMAGAYDLALDRIEELLSLRYYLALSPAQLGVDPRWDPLRQHPRFRQLVVAR